MTYLPLHEAKRLLRLWARCPDGADAWIEYDDRRNPATARPIGYPVDHVPACPRCGRPAPLHYFATLQPRDDNGGRVIVCEGCAVELLPLLPTPGEVETADAVRALRLRAARDDLIARGFTAGQITAAAETLYGHWTQKDYAAIHRVSLRSFQRKVAHLLAHIRRVAGLTPPPRPSRKDIRQHRYNPTAFDDARMTGSGRYSFSARAADPTAIGSSNYNGSDGGSPGVDVMLIERTGDSRREANAELNDILNGLAERPNLADAKTRKALEKKLARNTTPPPREGPPIVPGFAAGPDHHFGRVTRFQGVTCFWNHHRPDAWGKKFPAPSKIIWPGKPWKASATCGNVWKPIPLRSMESPQTPRQCSLLSVWNEGTDVGPSLLFGGVHPPPEAGNHHEHHSDRPSVYDRRSTAGAIPDDDAGDVETLACA